MEGVLIIFLVFILVFLIYFLQCRSHEAIIKDKIESIGGCVIKINNKYFETGPFLFVGRGQFIYRIEYSVDDTIKVGWVKFNGLFGHDWRL